MTEFVIDVREPIRSKRVRGKDIPYMTPEWKKAIRDTRKFSIKFAKERTEGNFALKKKYRNIATRERRKAIRAYWQTKSDELNTRPGAFYDTFKPFISDKTNKAVTIYLKRENGSLVKDQSEVADMLAIYFANVAKDIGGDAIKSLDNEKLEGHSSIVAIRNAHGGVSFDFENITTSQVQRALEDLNPKKSGGWESRISPRLFKLAAIGTTPSLASLFNSCLRQRKWPTAWKMGDWTGRSIKRAINKRRIITVLSHLSS